MANKPDLKAEGKELGVLIAAARKVAHQCAVLIAKDGVVIAADRKKSVKMMREAAKKDGGSGRGGWGELQVQGKNFILTCESEFPGNLEQLLKKHLAARGQPMQVAVRLKGADDPGQEAEEASSTEEDGPVAEVAEEEETEASTSTVANEADEEFPADENDPDDEDDAAAHAGDLAKLLAAAKKKPFNFAWLFSPDGMVLKAHRRKPTGVLIKQCRQEGASSRGAWGTMQVKGKVIRLTLEEDAPSSIIKRGKVYLRERGQNLKVSLVMPNGEQIDDDEDEQTQEASGPSQSVDAANSDEKAKLLAEFKAIKPEMEKALEADSPASKKIRNIANVFAKAVKEGDNARGRQALGLLSSTLKSAAKLAAKSAQEPAGALAPDDIAGQVDALAPKTQDIAKDFRRMVDTFRPFMEANHPQSDELAQEIKALREAIKGQDDAPKLEALTNLRRLEATVGTESEGDKPIEGTEGAMSQPLSGASLERLSKLLVENAQ